MEILSRVEATGAGGRREKEKYCFIGTEFSLGLVKKF